MSETTCFLLLLAYFEVPASRSLLCFNPELLRLSTLLVEGRLLALVLLELGNGLLLQVEQSTLLYFLQFDLAADFRFLLSGEVGLFTAILLKSNELTIDLLVHSTRLKLVIDL